jgi:putative nucleotidyltransferase with HDIG domain
MKPPATGAAIDVHDLQIGMFIHLDLGWMSHPFPLSSFKITNSEQIATIRSLGLTHVRWSPERSDLAPAVGDAAVVEAPVVDGESASAESAEAAERRERRETQAAQRAALQLCERQYAEATRALRQTSDMVTAQPQAAREQAEALSQSLVSKMLGQRELCIRLLSEGAGDRASSHGLNVAIIAMLMGKTFGLADSEMLDLGVGALLHDIGKIELPDRVRHVDDAFSSSELRLYQEHVAHGVAHAQRMGLSAGATLVIAQHHEQADGSGFPKRLNLDRMTASARIVALVNRYDNLCNPAQPSRAMTPHEALSLMFAQGKNKFDATMLNAFIRMMGVYPPGSVVQLTDERYALVSAVNSSRPLKPRVLVHDVHVPRDEALLLDLEEATDIGIRRSLKPQQLPAAAAEYLAPRQRIAYFFEPAPHPLPEETRW